jgi:hypothetical protein
MDSKTIGEFGWDQIERNMATFSIAELEACREEFGEYREKVAAALKLGADVLYNAALVNFVDAIIAALGTEIQLRKFARHRTN